jgi:hypothetical protein
MKEHVQAGFSRIFADYVRGCQVKQGRAQFGADGVDLESNLMLEKFWKICTIASNMFLLVQIEFRP